MVQALLNNIEIANIASPTKAMTSKMPKAEFQDLLERKNTELEKKSSIDNKNILKKDIKEPKQSNENNKTLSANLDKNKTINENKEDITSDKNINPNASCKEPDISTNEDIKEESSNSETDTLEETIEIEDNNSTDLIENNLENETNNKEPETVITTIEENLIGIIQNLTPQQTQVNENDDSNTKMQNALSQILNNQTSEINSTNNTLQTTLQNSDIETSLENVEIKLTTEEITQEEITEENIEEDLLDEEILKELNVESIDCESDFDTSNDDNMMQRQSPQELGIKTMLNSDSNNFGDLKTEFKLDSAQQTQTNKTNLSQNASPSKIFDQITKQMEGMQNGSKVNIVLNPESLGKVSVQLINTKEGLSAQFTVASQDAKNLIMKGLDGLKDNLLTHGINVDHVNVKLSETSNSQLKDNWTDKEGSRGGNKEENPQERKNNNKEQFEETMSFVENENGKV